MNPDTNSKPEKFPKEVEIKINNKEYHISRGNHTVVEIKNLGHVPLADDLLEVIKGKLTPLPDDGSVDIKGKEVFVSHPKGSSSS